MFRNLPLTRSLAGVFALLTFALASPIHGELVTVKLKTDYLPYDEFIQVETFFGPRSGPGGETQYRTVFSGEDFTSGAGLQVAEYDVPHGVYYLLVHLIDGAGHDAARQETIVDVFGAVETTTLITKPVGVAAEKTAALLTDDDGDGVVSAGDVIRYTVELQGRGSSAFLDEPDAGSRLIAGSVRTTHGVVSQGNTSGDTVVEISRIVLESSESATVVFDAEVSPVVRNQGHFFLAQIPGRGFRSLEVPTDDPGTAEGGDATILEVGCSFSSCEEDRAECRRRLEELLGDDDGDDVPTVLELCADTPPGEPVDDRGCSREQFCGLVDMSDPDGAAVCRGADWMGDEPLGNPRDCRAAGSVCGAS